MTNLKHKQAPLQKIIGVIVFCILSMSLSWICCTAFNIANAEEDQTIEEQATEEQITDIDNLEGTISANEDNMNKGSEFKNETNNESQGINDSNDMTVRVILDAPDAHGHIVDENFETVTEYKVYGRYFSLSSVGNTLQIFDESLLLDSGYLFAIPDEGYNFNGWEGFTPGKLYESDLDLYVHFKPVPKDYKITISGKVINNKTSEPLVGFEVYLGLNVNLDTYEYHDVYATVKTDENGYFVFDNISYKDVFKDSPYICVEANPFKKYAGNVSLISSSRFVNQSSYDIGNLEMFKWDFDFYAEGGHDNFVVEIQTIGLETTNKFNAPCYGYSIEGMTDGMIVVCQKSENETISVDLYIDESWYQSGMPAIFSLKITPVAKEGAEFLYWDLNGEELPNDYLEKTNVRELKDVFHHWVAQFSEAPGPGPEPEPTPDPEPSNTVEVDSNLTPQTNDNSYAIIPLLILFIAGTTFLVSRKTN